LDANANRAGEGLRVVEECVRFLRNDATLTQLLKQLRHDLASALEPIPRDQRLRARDTEGDVGTQLSTTAERERRNAEHIAAAGLKRTQEALRVIEEFSKLHWPHVSSASKQLRYRVYHAEKLLLS